ncbi:hypothetical protein Lal_00049607 [Lupinus albus]|nr:hypothetical protein Lal_00049607 [Lupinus albus]
MVKPLDATRDYGIEEWLVFHMRVLMRQNGFFILCEEWGSYGTTSVPKQQLWGYVTGKAKEGRGRFFISGKCIEIEKRSEINLSFENILTNKIESNVTVLTFSLHLIAKRKKEKKMEGEK